ncbi:unnamed protein product [Brassica oleracea]
MALNVEAKGGNGGKQWDDGFNYECVTKLHVRGGREGIQFIKFEYVKAGETTVGLIHGVSDRCGLTQTFEINHLEKEHLISVGVTAMNRLVFFFFFYYYTGVSWLYRSGCHVLSL